MGLFARDSFKFQPFSGWTEKKKVRVRRRVGTRVLMAPGSRPLSQVADRRVMLFSLKHRRCFWPYHCECPCGVRGQRRSSAEPRDSGSCLDGARQGADVAVRGGGAGPRPVPHGHGGTLGRGDRRPAGDRAVQPAGRCPLRRPRCSSTAVLRVPWGHRRDNRRVRWHSAEHP